MHISEVEKYRNEKDEHMRYGHLDKQDRMSRAMYSLPLQGEHNYHSPERSNVESAGKALAADMGTGNNTRQPTNIESVGKALASKM